MSLLNTLMLSCRKATHLMERQTMEELGMVDRLQLWMHVRLCDGCRAFQKQNKQIDELMAKREQLNAPVDTTVLEKRIVTALEKGHGSSN